MGEGVGVGGRLLRSPAEADGAEVRGSECGWGGRRGAHAGCGDSRGGCELAGMGTDV